MLQNVLSEIGTRNAYNNKRVKGLGDRSCVKGLAGPRVQVRSNLCDWTVSTGGALVSEKVPRRDRKRSRPRDSNWGN